MDLKAIADALAGRFTGITATSGGVTEGIAIGPTASLPNAIATGPALIVLPPVGVLEVGTSALRHDEFEFTVQLLRDPLNVPERTDWLYAWFGAMRDRVEMDTDLGLPLYVAGAQPVASRMEIDGETYAKTLMDVVELTVRVQLYEHVTTVAP